MAGMDPMAAPMPPQDPMMQAAPPSEEDVMLMLLQEVMGRWGTGEQIIAGEKQALIETLAMLAQSQAAPTNEMYVEGGPMPTDPSMGVM